ncbi:MAG: prepilin peptidase, partial [Nitrospiria bacterium]
MWVAVVFILGLLIGSFVNVCIYRLPRGESIVFPPSHCPSCAKPVKPYDNIPILSFILLRGKCRSCGVPISWQYPLVELVHALGYTFILHQFGLSPQALVYALFFSSLVVVSFIDLSHQIVPDVITLPGMALGLIVASTILPLGPINSLVGLTLGGGLFYLVAVLSIAFLKKEGLGGGDIKLIAMIGAFIGWKGMLLTIF